MTLLPLIAWPLILVAVIAGLAAVWWNPSSRGMPGESRGGHWRRTAAVLLLGVAALRPALSGDEVATTGANINVYFVVDTTSSVIAEDWGGERPRVQGMRADIDAIAAAIPGARFSVVTFDQATRVRLPLTTDTTALAAAIDTLLPEPSEYSRGSSVTQPNDRLRALLEQANTRHPDRGRVVFYLGDGEQTAPEPPTPFAIPAGLIHGGAVLGYGTTEGGRMKATRARFGTSSDYLKDPATGEDARSVFSEATLRSIGAQLGLPYRHREQGADIDPVVAGIDLGRFGTSEQLERQKLRARQELYWPLLLGVAAIAVWELGAAAAALAQTRRRAGAGS